MDDDPLVTDLTTTFLKREDDRFAVETATSADEGLQQLSDRPPDCIVSDYNMLGMDGLEFLQAVREHPPLSVVGNGGQARVQYTVLDVTGQSSVALEFTTPSQVSVDADASDTTGTFSSNAQQLLFLQPGDEITTTVAFDIASDASTDTTFDTDTAALDKTVRPPTT